MGYLRGEERSDEWKVISYMGKLHNAITIASLEPALVPVVPDRVLLFLLVPLVESSNQVWFAVDTIELKGNEFVQDIERIEREAVYGIVRQTEALAETEHDGPTLEEGWRREV